MTIPSMLLPFNEPVSGCRAAQMILSLILIYSGRFCAFRITFKQSSTASEASSGAAFPVPSSTVPWITVAYAESEHRAHSLNSERKYEHHLPERIKSKARSKLIPSSSLRIDASLHWICPYVPATTCFIYYQLGNRCYRWSKDRADLKI